MTVIIAAILGILLLAAGVAVQFGLGWGLIAAGVCFVASAVVLYDPAGRRAEGP